MSTYTEVSIKNKENLIRELTASGINTESWDTGSAKTVDDLLKEIKSGETLILKDSKTNKLVRMLRPTCRPLD